MSTEPTVIDELGKMANVTDALGWIDDGSLTSIKLRDIRTRIAALVEAATLARDFLAGETHGNTAVLSDESMSICHGCVAHIALSTALKGIEQ